MVDLSPDSDGSEVVRALRTRLPNMDEMAVVP